MNFPPCFAAARKLNFAFLVSTILLAVAAPRALAQDDDYLAIYNVVEQADALAAGGKMAAAHAKYAEAQRELTEFRQANPNWNVQMVSFRVSYVAEKIKATSGTKISAPADDNFNADENAAASSKPKAAGAALPVRLLDAGSEPRKISGVGS